MDRENLFNVKDKVVLVTGGGKGVGEYITEGYVTNGAKVYITGRDTKALEATCSRLNKLGKGSCFPISGNLANPQELQRVIQELKAKENALHILVNNAGASWGSDLESITPASYDWVMNLNVKSLFFIILGLLPLLKAAAKPEDPARVINIGSIQGILTGNNSPIYDISKAAVHHLTKSLAAILTSKHILVNAIALGLYETKMTRGSIESGGKENIYRKIPLGRAGNPTEISGTCIYLSSPASNYVSGAILVVDGGTIASKRPSL